MNEQNFAIFTTLSKQYLLASPAQMHHDLELFLGKRVRGPIPAKSEEEFLSILGQILRSEDTQKVINSLAMSNGGGNKE